MSTNFLEKFLRTNPLGLQRDDFSIAQLGATGQGLANMLPVVNELYATLSNKVQTCSEILPALIHDSDLLPDVTLINEVIEDNDPTLFVSEIESETVDIIVSSYLATTEFSGQTCSNIYSNSDAITITDQQGRVYELIHFSNAQPLSDGSIPIIATTIDPSSCEDCLIYQKDDKFYCNTKVRSKGFWRSNSVYEELHTVMDNLLSILDWGGYVSYSSSIYGILSDVCTALDVRPEDDIINTLYVICQELDVDYDSQDTMIDLLSNIRYKLYQNQHDQDFGVERFYGDIISDLMHADTLNQILMSACDLARNGRFTIDSFNQTIANVMNNEVSVGAKKLVTGINSAFAVGGIYGVIKYIINFVHKGTSVSMTDENGVLQFTDNRTLVPTEYIAGLACTVIGTVLSAVGLIAMAFSRILGAALSLIGSLVMTIPKLINYDYNTATWAGFNSLSDDESGQIILPYFPHGIFQGTMNKSELNIMFRNAINDGCSCFLCNVPGGVIIVGPDVADNKVRYEFHPAVAKVERSFIGGDLEWLAWYDLDGETIKGYNLSLSVYNQATAWDLTATRLLQLWEMAQPLDINGDEECLISNTFDDARLRFAFMRNTVIFWCWCVLSDGRDLDSYYLDKNSIILNITLGTHEVDIVPFNYDYTFIPDMPWQQPNINPFFYLWMTDLNIQRMLNAEFVYYHDEGVRSADIETMDLYLQHSTLTDDANHFIPVWNQMVEFVNNINADNITAFVPQTDYEHQLQRDMHTITWLPLSSCYDVMRSGMIINQVLDVPQNFKWAIATPKYNRSTFMLWVTIATLITVAVTVATVVATVKIRKAIRTKQAKNIAKVESAWSDFTSNPSTETYNQYRKAVTKNNLFASITGGTKYSKQNYWAGDASDSQDGLSGVINSAKALSLDQDDGAANYLKSSDNNEAISDNTDKTSQIIRLIRN